MLILDRVFWLINSAVTVLIVAIVALMLLRLIANLANPNPFGWTSQTIRRLTDPLIGPVRRALVRVGIDHKYAPLVAILATILLGWFAIQIVSAATWTADGILRSVLSHALKPFIGYLLSGLLSFYVLLIFLRVIFSWVNVRYSHRWMRLLISATEPLLGPLRRAIPLIAGFDVSPLVALLIVQVLQTIVSRTLISG
ncbi:MAG: YggT family protein [Pyrinomonadaceae bacterium]